MLILHGENVPLLLPTASSILQQQNQVGDGGGKKGGDQAAINLHGKFGQIYRVFFYCFLLLHLKKISELFLPKNG